MNYPFYPVLHVADLVALSAMLAVVWACWLDEEAINRLFCPLQEKFHTFVLRGLRNISEAP
jgi:hypothetical protein